MQYKGSYLGSPSFLYLVVQEFHSYIDIDIDIEHVYNKCTRYRYRTSYRTSVQQVYTLCTVFLANLYITKKNPYGIGVEWR